MDFDPIVKHPLFFYCFDEVNLFKNAIIKSRKMNKLYVTYIFSENLG